MTRSLRRRSAVPAIAVVVAAGAVAVVLATRSGEVPPATGAAALVPADALAYVHVSTDASRPGVTRALAVARRLPDYGLLGAAVVSRVTAIAAGGNSSVDYAHDVRPWLGKEAALALLNTTSSTAGSLVVLDVRQQAAAHTFLEKAGASSVGSYRGVQVYGYRSGTELAFLAHYLVFGQGASVRAAIDASVSHSGSLADNPDYKRAAAGEPADRVLDAYASAAGVQRLLLPQGGLVAALGDLLYQPALTAITISLSGTSSGAKLYVRSALNPRLAQAGAGQSTSFAPTLESVIPAGSSLMLDVTGLDRIASHVLAAGAAGGVARNLGPLLRRLGAALASEGVNVQSIESLFSGETAVAIGPGSPAAGRSRSPELIIVTRAQDETATRAQLANLEVPLSQLFPAPSSGSGQVPEFNQRQINGITAHQLSLAPGLEFDYAVFRGLVVISTSLSGIRAVAVQVHSLADEKSYHATLGSHHDRVTSLVFLDFSQLLSLAEQTGLFRGARYQMLRPDLNKIRAVGLDSTRGEADSTAELFLQIP